MRLEEEDDSLLGILIVIVGIVIMIATELFYAIFGIWEIKYGTALGMIVIIVGIVKILIELEIIKFKKHCS